MTRLDDETRRIPASMLTDPPDFDVSDEPGLPGEFVDVASLLAEVVRLRATIERVRAVTDALRESIEWDQRRHNDGGPSLIDAAKVLSTLAAALGPAGADRQEQP